MFFSENGRNILVLSDRRNHLKELKIIAETDRGTVMGIKYKNAPVYGFQFHPESILTDYGHKIIKNFLRCS